MNQELLRLVDGICRDKNIERETFLTDLENALLSAVKKAFETEEAEVKLDPLSGAITASANGQPIGMQQMGRIAAQTAKQVIIQKSRERERASVFEEFTERRGSIITGTVTRNDNGNCVVNLGRAEGFLPRSEQIPGEGPAVGARIRVLILEVREQGTQVKIILSRSHPEFVVRLFELEVPEVAERIIEIKAIARESGYRTKVAVSSIDMKVDAVGACVGVRGSRIKNIVEELGGEKIDIVRWNESSQILIQNALKPAEVQEIALCLELGKATVVVNEDQLSLAIGKRGQNVRLASRLTGWDIDILTPVEYNKNLETLEQTLKRIPGLDDVMVDKFVALGCVSVNDVDEIGPETFVEQLSIDAELAEKIVYEAGEEAIHQEEAKEEAAKIKAAENLARLRAGPTVAATEDGAAAEGATEGNAVVADGSEPNSEVAVVSAAEESSVATPALSAAPESTSDESAA